MGNEKNSVKPNGNANKKKSKSNNNNSIKTKKKKGGSSMTKKSFDDNTSSKHAVTTALPYQKRSESGDEVGVRRKSIHTVDIGQISRRFLDSTSEFNENGSHGSKSNCLISSEIQNTVGITEGTPASEAIRANASVRVTKFDKLTRKLKLTGFKKSIKRAATLRTPNATRRGKPPRVPHHSMHWNKSSNATYSYPEEELRAHFVTSLNPIAETKDVYIQQTKSETVGGMPYTPQQQQHPTTVGQQIVEEESMHERRQRRRPRRKKKKKQRAYVKGKVIDGKHELYALSIAVMLGLRTSIGMTNGQLLDNRIRKIDNNDDEETKNNYNSPTMWLTSDDFMGVEKYAFRPKGGPKTPPHVLSHTFKFKDYSPKAFAYIRRLFGINEYDFLSSVCGNANFIEFISNAKSGQFFFYSSDGKYMIKTMTGEESKFLRRILPHYFRHCVANPNTLLARFFGMYRVKMYHIKRNTKFVIMNSVYDTNKYLDTFYDLKGSVTGRDAKPSDDVKKDNDVRRDLHNTSLSMLPEVREKMRKQLESDCAFLSSMKIMDYSMLIGVHHIPLGGAHADAASAPFEHMDKSNDSSVQNSTSIRNVLAQRTRPGHHDNKMHGHATSKSNDNDNNAEVGPSSHAESKKLSPSFSERFLDQELNNAQYCNENFFKSDTADATTDHHQVPNVPFSVAVSTSTPVDADYDEDDDSYLDGEHNRYSSLINSKQQQFHPENSIEIRKLEAAEQVYWPFQRLFDSLGHRRMVPILTPVEDTDDRQDSSNSTVSSKWELPDFISPVSNRKDAGLVMDVSHFNLPLNIPSTSNHPHLQHCGGKIFYMGIIDVLQQFNTRKRAEAHYRRLLGSGWADASCVHPIRYADRFIKFFDQYTKQYLENQGSLSPSSSTDKANIKKDNVHEQPMLTLEDISDDDEDGHETIVFFDEQCEKEGNNKKVKIRSINTQKVTKSKNRKKPSSRGHARSSS